MADKKFDFNSGIGDISGLMHNRGVADLSWLSVDEDDYRAAEVLPKQNLDIIPELQKALAMDDDVPHLIPMRPHTMVNSRPGPLPVASGVDMSAPIRNRVARLIMAGFPNSEIQKRLALEFAPGDVDLASSDIERLEQERGLLGNVYIDASHFPRAASDPKEKKLAKALGKNAIYVIGGCGGCNGCNCHETGLCNTFSGKRVVSEVPYGSNIAAHYAPRLAAEKRPLELADVHSGPEVWKQRLRSAFLKAPISSNPDGVQTVHTQIQLPKTAVTSEQIRDFISRSTSNQDSHFVLSTEYKKYSRRMQYGYNDVATLAASTDPELNKLASEWGLLGHSYVDIDTLGGCRLALSLVQDRGLAPDFIIRRSASCNFCHDDPAGACASLCSRGATLVRSHPVLDRIAFGKALKRAVDQGRMLVSEAKRIASNTPKEHSNWGYVTAQTNLLTPDDRGVSRKYSGVLVKLHPNVGSKSSSGEIDPEEVRRTLSHLMNSGLSGKELQYALLSRYSREDLSQVPEIGRRASADDGIQGTYFIDPSAYKDYGRGCDEGAKHFRKRGAPYIFASSGCNGCTLQTAPGWCSKYSKQMIRQVPSQIREHVASAKRKLPVIQSAPIENPVEKYELASDLEFDVNGTKFKDVEIKVSGSGLGDIDKI